MIYQDTTKPVTIPFCHKMGKEPNVNGICVAEDSYNELINSDEVKERIKNHQLYLVAPSMINKYEMHYHQNMSVGMRDVVGYVTNITDDHVDVVLTNDEYSIMIKDNGAYAGPTFMGKVKRETTIIGEDLNYTLRMKVEKLLFVELLDKMTIDANMNYKKGK